MKQKSTSLRVRVLVICLLTTGAIVCIFLTYGVYNVFRYREDFLNTNRYVADFYASQLKRDVESLKSYVNNILSTNIHYGMLSHAGISEKNRVWAEYYLNNALESKATSLQQYGGLFYYDKDRNAMRSQFSEAFSNDELYFLNVALKEWLQQCEGDPGSRFVKLEGRVYYLSAVGGPGHCVGFFLELERYFQSSLSSEGDEAQLLFLDGEGEVLTWVGKEILSEEKIKVTQKASWCNGHNYALVKSEVLEGTLELVLVRPFWQFLHFWMDWRFWVFLGYCEQWEEAGLLLDDPLNQSLDKSYLKTGVAGGAFTTGFSLSSIALDMTTTYNFDAVVFPLSTAAASVSSTAGAGYCISTVCDNPDAAMKLLYLMYTDEQVMRYFAQGIEDVHYVVDENGCSWFPEGESQTTLGWGTGAQWYFPNQTLCIPFETTDPDYYKDMVESNETCEKSVAIGFAFDNSSVYNEYTAVSNVVDEYLKALTYAQVDVDDMLPEFLSELDAAGIDTVIEERQKQLDEFLAQ